MQCFVHGVELIPSTTSFFDRQSPFDALGQLRQPEAFLADGFFEIALGLQTVWERRRMKKQQDRGQNTWECVEALLPSLYILHWSS
jgi:hypothetical protein